MIPLIAIALLATPASTTSHPAWMVGRWGWQNPDEHKNSCDSGYVTTYHSDGRYHFMDEAGMWRIDGDQLIETMTDPGGTGDPAYRGIPLRYKRIGARAFEAVGQPNPGKLIKCADR